MAADKLKIVYKDADSLIPALYNPRQMTKEQKAELKQSLEQFGFVDPLIVNVHPDRANVVVGGHMRLNIAKELGMTKIPCLEVNLDEAAERELNVRLNKNVGEWDWDALATYFDAENLMDWGFKDWELGLKDTALSVTADEAAKLRDDAGERYDDKDVNAGHVRLVQLFYNPEELEDFTTIVETEREANGGSVSDAVLRIVRQWSGETE